MVFRFTARVATLMDVLGDLNKGIYKRTMISSQQNRNGECQNDKGNGNI